MIDFVESKTVDHAHVARLLESSCGANRWTNGGPVVATLEAALATWLETSCPVIACNNGTIALFALVEMHNLLAGRPLRWAVSSFGFACSHQGPLRDAAVVDCDARGVLDLDQLPDDCEGIVLTNIFGTMSDVAAVRRRVEASGRVFICDSAGAFDCCSHGPNEIISLHHTKPWGFGEGGCAIVASEHEALFRSLIAFGKTPTERHHATNGKMSDVAAAYIIQWLDGCPARVPVYQEQFARLAQAGIKLGFVPLAGIGVFTRGLPQNLPMVAPVPVEPPAGAMKYYRPIAATPVATDLFARIINLPCHGGVASLKSVDGLFPAIECRAAIGGVRPATNARRSRGVPA